MVARLTRIGSTFVAVLATYWAYSLLVVPVVEPATQKRTRPRATARDIDTAKEAGRRNSQLLAGLFPAGAWERNESVKVLETEQAKLLVNTYEPLPNGQVRLHPCTILFYPRNAASGAQAPRPVILQAPEGAVLEFDRAVDLRQAKFGGDFVGGQLVGPIRIHSPPSRPGADDGLEILTRDIQLRDQRLTSAHPVTFRMAGNSGSGREMLMILAPAEGGKSNKHGTAIGGMQSFELLRDVKLHLELGGAGPIPLSGRTRDDAPQNASGHKPGPPVEVTCRGPFRYDVPGQVATFSESVDVMQLNANGQSDQLSCEMLSIYFARKEGAVAQPGSRQSGLSDLEARYIEASGDPVVVRSPGRGAHAQCQVLKYDIKTQRITLEGNREVRLHQETNDIGARRLEYTPAGPGRLGQLSALGPGWLQSARRDNPSQVYQARWTEKLTLMPHENNHVLSLVGGAYMRATDSGAMNADEIHLWVRETASQEAEPPRASRLQPVSFRKRNDRFDIQPLSMLAVGKVRVDSPALTGATARLEILFRKVFSYATGAAGTSTLSTSGATPIESLSRPRGTRRLPAGGRRFDVGGRLVRIQVAMRPERQDVADVSIEGNARLEELKTAQTPDKPLIARGERLHLAQADTEKKAVTVAGKPAFVQAEGMTLSGATIDLEQATNRMWVKGAGRMTLPASRKQTAFGSGPLEILWQGGMSFDGLTASYERSVMARSTHMLLKTERLDVALTRKIDFANPPDRNAPKQEIDVARLVCSGGAFFENHRFDERGQTSTERMDTRDLSIDRVTGAIEGHGPGEVTTLRRGFSQQMLAPPGQRPAATPVDPKNDNRLTYLNVRFERSISGNLHRSEISFGGDVEAVHGPVETWQQKLVGDDPAAIGPDGALLKCDTLTVRDMVVGRQPQGAAMELEAVGNASVEGATYHARAHSLRYNRLKDRLDLEGTGSTDAQLMRQGSAGTLAARKITFWRTLNQVNVEDVRFIDSGPLPSASKPATPAR